MSKIDTKFWARFAAVYICGALFWALIVRFYPRESPPMMAQFSGSVFQQYGYVVLLLLLFLFVTFLHLAVSFVRVEKHLAGNRYQRGTVFGVGFGLIWVLGFVEYHQFFGGTVGTGLWAGLGDFLALSFFGVLAGHFLGDASLSDRPAGRPFRCDIVAVLWFPLCFTIGRCLFYQYLAGFQLRPVDEIGVVTEVLLGCGIGLLFYCFRGAFVSEGKGLGLSKELSFALLFFGPNWALFTLYPLIKFAIPPFKVVALVGIDLAALVAALFLYKLSVGANPKRVSDI